VEGVWGSCHSGLQDCRREGPLPPLLFYPCCITPPLHDRERRESDVRKQKAKAAKAPDAAKPAKMPDATSMKVGGAACLWGGVGGGVGRRHGACVRCPPLPGRAQALKSGKGKTDPHAWVMPCLLHAPAV